MKLILVNQRYGHTRTIVIRGWMKGLLSLCLLGAPVALGYLGYELALADTGSNALVSQEVPAGSEEPGGSEEIVGSNDDVLLPTSLTTFAENPSGKTRPADGFFQFWTLASAIASSAVLLADTPSSSYKPARLAVFSHGRLIDPASYLRHILH